MVTSDENRFCLSEFQLNITVSVLNIKLPLRILLAMSLHVTFQEQFYDPVSLTGFLEYNIRQKRSRDPKITTLWTNAKKRRSNDWYVTAF